MVIIHITGWRLKGSTSCTPHIVIEFVNGIDITQIRELMKIDTNGFLYNGKGRPLMIGNMLL